MYREVHFVGRERIPAAGPVLLFGNHPNDVPDVLAGFFTTTRQVRYVATISATTMPLASATYRGLGVIPVTRVRDARKMRAKGIDVAAVNREANDTLRDAFRSGDVVGVFPEGGVADLPHIGKQRTGVAKMALESFDNDQKNDLKLVPFGVQYENPRDPRSDLMVHVGEPFSLVEWLADHPHPSPVALAERMRQSLEAVTRNSPTWEAAGDRDRLTACAAALCAPPGVALLDAAVMLQAKATGLAEHSVRLRTVVNAIDARVREAGGRAESARDVARTMAAASMEGVHQHAQWPSAWAVSLTAPFALTGLAIHVPIWAIVWWAARKMSVDRTDPVAKAILPGLHLIFVLYLILGGAMALGFRAIGLSGWWSMPVVMLLPRLGDLALLWRDSVRALRLRRRVGRWPLEQRTQLRAMASELRTLWNSALLNTSPPDSAL